MFRIHVSAFSKMSLFYSRNLNDINLKEILSIFNIAKVKMGDHQDKLDNNMKLKFYGLYKQATEGKCTSKEPSAFDFVGKAKYQAWKLEEKLSQTEAMEQYVKLYKSISNDQSLNDRTSEPSEPVVEKINDSEPVIINKNSNSITLEFNRSRVHNALNMRSYELMTNALLDSNENSEIRYIHIKSVGKYFSSGHDFKETQSELMKQSNPKEFIDYVCSNIRKFLLSLVECKKLVVVTIQGHAIGIAVTILPHCDFVYSSNLSTYSVPFLKLGIVQEAASSYLFPRLMGKMSNEMIFRGRKIDAQTALKCGLVSEVFDSTLLKETVNERLIEFSNLNPQLISQSKSLMIKPQLSKIKESIDDEMAIIKFNLMNMLQ